MAAKQSARKGDDGGAPRRLGRYGVTAKQLLPQRLIVPPRKKLRLTTERGKCLDRGYVQLKPKSMDDVKKWIGVADAVAQKRGCALKCPKTGVVVNTAADAQKLKPAELKALYDLGRIYVYGDSKVAAAYRTALDLLLSGAVINAVFVREDIDVYPDSVLEIGQDIRLLWARNIRIWAGGTIQCEGSTKIDCESIQGNYRGAFKLSDFAKYSTPLGILSSLEVGHA